MKSITSKERGLLRAQGNTLKPVLMIGQLGVNEAVITALEESFKVSPLAKVKLQKSCTLSIKAVADCLCGKTDAIQIQHIGRTILLYQPVPN